MKTSMAITPTPLVGVPFLFAGRAAEGVRCAAELGYDAVELHLRDPRSPDVPDLVRRVGDAGLAVSSLGTGQGFTLDKLCISDPDAAVRTRAFDRLVSHVELAGRLGAVVIIGSMQGRLAAEPDARAGQTAAAVELLHRLGDVAHRLGVRVALEPLNRYETNFLNRARDVLALLDRVDRPALGVLLDTFHMNIEEPSMTEAIAAVGARLCLVHLSDSHRGAAGLGHTDFAPIIAALRATGFAGYLSAEVLPLGDDRLAAEAGLRTMRRLIGKETR